MAPRVDQENTRHRPSSANNTTRETSRALPKTLAREAGGTGAIGGIAINAFLQKILLLGLINCRASSLQVDCVYRVTAIPMCLSSFEHAFRIEVMRTAHLQLTHGKAENGAVRNGRQFAILAAALLCASLTALPQTAARPHMLSSARIDINHASVDEMMKAPGMTRSWAGRIVRFRPYRTRLDLVERGVVTSQVYDRIKDYLIAHRDKQ